MYPLMKSIAVAVVVFAAYPATGAEAAKSPAPPSAAAASPVFADSFGLSIAERTPVAKQQGYPVPSEQRAIPAADSFGLNDAPHSAVADCSAPKAGRSVAKPPRCIEM